MIDTVRAAGTLDLTVHRRDLDVEPKAIPAKGPTSRYRAIVEHPDGNALKERLAPREWNGHAGATVCGKPMLLEELWVNYVPELIDRLCPRCFPDRLAATA